MVRADLRIVAVPELHQLTLHSVPVDRNNH